MSENAAPPVPDAAASRIQLDFDPARDGFAFPNSFRWTPDDLRVLASALRPVSGLPLLAGAALGGLVGGGGRGALAGGAVGAGLARLGGGDGIVRTVAQRWATFGLCGGMALAAIERWPQRGRLATGDLQPDPVRALLRRRQERTLRWSLPQFASYWARVRFVPGNTPYAPFADDLQRELDAIEQTLRVGRPVLIGLVGDAPDPFSNHQVVVFGIERQGLLEATLDVYDPNAPGRTRHVTTAPAPVPGRTSVTTDIPTGRRESGRCHISTRPGHLAHLFAIPVRDDG